MAGEIVRELRNCVNEIIILIEQRNFCDEDLLQFRLDWLYNAMVRYVDQIPSGVAIVNLVREASALFILENGGNDIRNFAFKPELSYTGRPGRPTTITWSVVNLVKIFTTGICYRQKYFIEAGVCIWQCLSLWQKLY